MAKRAKAAIGIDVGGTYTKIGAVSESGRVLREAQLPSQVEEGPKAFVQRISNLIESWRAERPIDLDGIGLGIAGDVDSRRGVVRFTPNLPGWNGFDFRKAFYARLKRRVAVENDANAAVWGGYVRDLSRKPKGCLGVTLGTGVGGGIILNGALYRGATGSAGEIGHTKVAEGGEPCHCGARGCLEAYAGKYGIIRTARKILADDPKSGKVLLEICPDLEKLEPKHLSMAADQGDAAARQVWRLTAGYLGTGIGNVVLLLNVDAVLVLGGVSRAGHWIMDPLAESLSKQTFRVPFNHVKIKLADDTRAGWIGAALLSLEKEP